jgi:hypothetical protein
MVSQMAKDTDQLRECKNAHRDTPGIKSEIAQITSKIGSAGQKKTAPAVLPTLESGA